MKSKFGYLWFLILLPLVLSPATFSSLAGVLHSAAPRNDNFFNATRIRNFSGSITGSNKNATKENFEVNIAGNKGGASIWYVWEAPDWKMLEFNTFGSNFDTLLGVYTWPDPSKPLKTIVTNDDSREYPGRVSQASFPAAKGKKYYIVVDGFNTGNNAASGKVVLNWSSSDIISQPVQLPVGDLMDHPPVFWFACAFGSAEPGVETIAGGKIEKPAQLELCLARFRDGEIDAVLTGPDGQENPLPSFLLSSSQPGSSWKYVIPLDYPVGMYQIKLTQGDSSVTYTFQLVEATQPNFVVDPGIRVGHSFNLYLAGFPSNQSILLHLFRKDSSICPPTQTCFKYLTSYRARSDSNGQGTYKLIIKPEYGSGDYVIQAVSPDQEIYEVKFTASQ